MNSRRTYSGTCDDTCPIEYSISSSATLGSRYRSYGFGQSVSGPNIWRTSVSPSQPGQYFLVKFHEAH